MGIPQEMRTQVLKVGLTLCILSLTYSCGGKPIHESGGLEAQRSHSTSQDLKRLRQALAKARLTQTPEDLNSAVKLYQAHLKTTLPDQSFHEIAFHYGEMLYQAQRWEEAAEGYARALKADPKGQFVRGAAYGFYLCHHQLLKSEETNREQRAETDTQHQGRVGDSSGVKYPKNELSERQNRLISAGELYREHVRDGEHTIEISYEEARLYYSSNHFDRAIPLFKEIAENHVTHRLAPLSVHLLLKCYQRRGDIDGFMRQIQTLIKLYPPSKHAKLSRRLKLILNRIDFKRCEFTENRGELRESAQCFERYYQRSSGSDLGVKAILNAAALYERAGMMKRSLELRMRLLNDEDFPQRAEVMYLISQTLERLAIYGESARFYELFALEFPREERAESSLLRAAELRAGLEEYKQAIKDLNIYIKLTKRRLNSLSRAVEAYLLIGKLHEERAQWSQVIKHYKAFKHVFKRMFKRVSAGDRARVYTAIGRAYQNMSKERQALAAYEASINAYRELTDTARSEAGLEVRYAIAEASFQVANARLKTLKRSSQLKVRGSQGQSFNHYKSKMAQAIKSLLSTYEEIKGLYEQVLMLNVEHWGLAALTQLGQLYEMIYTELRETPPPPMFKEPELLKEFRAMMASQVDPLRQSAVRAYQVSLEKSRELRYVNEWTELAAQRIVALNPERSSRSAEDLPSPTELEHQPRVDSSELREAIAHARAALSRRGADVEAYRILAQVYPMMKRDRLALLVIKSGLQISPDDSSLLTARGVIYVKRGKLNGAIRSFERAIKDPKSFAARFNLGILSLKFHDIERSYKLLKEASEMKPKHAGAQRAFAIVTLKLKRQKEKRR